VLDANFDFSPDDEAVTAARSSPGTGTAPRNRLVGTDGRRIRRTGSRIPDGRAGCRRRPIERWNDRADHQAGPVGRGPQSTR
jgi:hypothetical protein